MSGKLLAPDAHLSRVDAILGHDVDVAVAAVAVAVADVSTTKICLFPTESQD